MNRCECGCRCRRDLSQREAMSGLCATCVDGCRAACTDCGRTIGAWRYRCRDCADVLAALP